jgi:hypothetical protein
MVCWERTSVSGWWLSRRWKFEAGKQESVSVIFAEVKEEVMERKLPSLPYANDALIPYISTETIEYHYGKHH